MVFQYLFKFSMYGPMKFVWIRFEIIKCVRNMQNILRTEYHDLKNTFEKSRFFLFFFGGGEMTLFLDWISFFEQVQKSVPGARIFFKKCFRDRKRDKMCKTKVYYAFMTFNLHSQQAFMRLSEVWKKRISRVKLQLTAIWLSMSTC